MDIESCPCPKCGEYGLVYDGMLIWRSGSRPPRELATKKEVFLPRADYERERLYHCQQCGAEYFEDVDQHITHLYAEKGGGRYEYNQVWRTWQPRR